MYKSQYEDYYSSLKKRNFSNDIYRRYEKRTKNKKSNFFVKKLMIDLVGVLVLAILVIGLKAISTPKTKMAYNYSKKIVNENYDYKPLFSKVKKLKYEDIKEHGLKFIDTFKSKITGENTVYTRISKDFVVPVNGKVTSKYGERKDPFTGKKKKHNGIDISVKENTKVVSCFKGKVKDCGNDKDFGKYITIDHGKGIETKYAHLNNISVKKGESLKKGQLIGKSGNTGKSTGPHLHFELIYMGESKNPQYYFDEF